MSKRRTKKQKESVRHPFTLSWNSSQESVATEAPVKGQTSLSIKAKSRATGKLNSADISAQEASIKYVKHDILRSLAVVSLVLCLELVIYLAWKGK